MAQLKTSMKQMQIDKANMRMVLAVAVSAAVVVFSLVASRALLQKRSYQAKVIGAKEKAVDQLEANITAAQQLSTAYKTFVSTSTNVLGGNPQGTGDKDGDNAKIILDALPSQYDFPALASSLEKVLTANNLKIGSITGTDDEIAQGQQQEGGLQPIEVPFTIAVTTNLDGAKNLVSVLQRSIRPIHIRKLEMSGSNSNLSVSIDAVTYYQPQKTVNIKTEVIQQ